MPTGGPFPSTEAELNDYIHTVAPYLNAEGTRLGVSGGNITSLNTLTPQWDDYYPKSVNPNTSTKTIRDNKNATAKAIKTLLRSIYDDIPESVLTTQDRQTLNLQKRDTTHTPVPVANHAPLGSIEKMQHLLITLRITDPEHPATQAMPSGQRGEVHIAVQQPNDAPLIWDADRSYIATRFLSDVSFNEEDLGKKAYFRFRYVNTKGETGPWSESITVVVS